MKIKNEFLRHTKLFFPDPRISLYHTYNGVVVNKTPWIVEVEQMVPRYGHVGESSALYRYGMSLLRGEYCKRILFSSQYARNEYSQQLLSAGISPAKIGVLYRAVGLHDRVRRIDGKCRILFVGNAFYRKGGLQLVAAFAKLADPSLELRIVSSFEVDWRVFPTESEVAEVKKLISGDSRIRVLSGLRNDQVIEEMCHADIFTCPTFADTFNNTILEAMACGLPIVATNVYAIPEFVADRTNGFLVEVDQAERENLTPQLQQALTEVAEDSRLRDSFGQASKQIIEERFTIERRNEELRVLYDQTLARP